MVATSVEYERILGNISENVDTVARCACVACNSCTCACSCRKVPKEEEIKW